MALMFRTATRRSRRIDADRHIYASRAAFRAVFSQPQPHLYPNVMRCLGRLGAYKLWFQSAGVCAREVHARYGNTAWIVTLPGEPMSAAVRVERTGHGRARLVLAPWD